MIIESIVCRLRGTQARLQVRACDPIAQPTSNRKAIKNIKQKQI